VGGLHGWTARASSFPGSSSRFKLAHLPHYSRPLSLRLDLLPPKLWVIHASVSKIQRTYRPSVQKPFDRTRGSSESRDRALGAPAPRQYDSCRRPAFRVSSIEGRATGRNRRQKHLLFANSGAHQLGYNWPAESRTTNCRRVPPSMSCLPAPSLGPVFVANFFVVRSSIMPSSPSTLRDGDFPNTLFGTNALSRTSPYRRECADLPSSAFPLSFQTYFRLPRFPHCEPFTFAALRSFTLDGKLDTFVSLRFNCLQ